MNVSESEFDEGQTILYYFLNYGGLACSHIKRELNNECTFEFRRYIIACLLR